MSDTDARGGAHTVAPVRPHPGVAVRGASAREEPPCLEPMPTRRPGFASAAVMRRSCRSTHSATPCAISRTPTPSHGDVPGVVGFWSRASAGAISVPVVRLVAGIGGTNGAVLQPNSTIGRGTGMVGTPPRSTICPVRSVPGFDGRFSARPASGRRVSSCPAGRRAGAPPARRRVDRRGRAPRRGGWRRRMWRCSMSFEWCGCRRVRSAP